MPKATNTKERNDQRVMLRQAADGKLGAYKDMPSQMQKDLRADKALWARAVKNGVAPGAKKTTTKK